MNKTKKKDFFWIDVLIEWQFHRELLSIKVHRMFLTLVFIIIGMNFLAMILLNG